MGEMPVSLFSTCATMSRRVGSPGSSIGRRLSFFAAWPVFFAFAVTLQRWGGAYGTELSGYPDEPAHFVSGVMASRYLATLPPAPMVPFAADYYIHYPKVAIGHWPPVFYVVQGIWFLLLGVSRTSVLLLAALISSLVSLTLFAVVRREFGLWAGAAAGLLFQCIPVVWTQTEQVMSDLLVGLFGLWAALAFADFAREERRRDLFRFAFLTALTIFTKGNGLYLALVPPLTLAMTSKLRLLLSPRVWLSAALVGLPTGAWFIVSRRYVVWGETPSLSLFWRSLSPNVVFLVSIFGIAFFVLICAGLFRKVVRPLILHGSTDQLWAALASVTVSVYLFQSMIWGGVREPRFLTPAIPALIPFLFAGAEWLAQLSAPLGGTRRIRTVAVLACSAGLFTLQTLAVPRKPYWGFIEAADSILSRPESHGAAILVSSEADGEGLLISEIAMRQPHPDAFILRASKVLAQADWLGRNYKARFQSPGELTRYLEDIPVDFLVIDQRPELPSLTHQRLLLEAAAQNTGRWLLLGAFPQRRPSSRPGSRILVYQRKGAPGHPEQKVRLEMGRILQQIMEK